MKLAKALKTKNRIAGQIALTQRLIEENNVTEGENKPAHDVRALYSELRLRQVELAELKGKISNANSPISERIFKMAEMKAAIAFLRTLSTKDGKFLVEGRYGHESTERTYSATLKSTWVEEEVKKLSEMIDKLQDEIDEFNATTEI